MIRQTIDQPPVGPNEELVRLTEILQRRLANQVQGFRLIAFNGGLVLLGQSSTYYAKQLAQHALMGATDLPIVSNEIEVASRSLN
jgi:hypothetical protein